MPEQFSLDLGEPKQPSPLERMSVDELKALYLTKVGVSARIGRDSREHLIWAIEHPGEERAGLQRIDRESDAEDRENTYRRKI